MTNIDFSKAPDSGFFEELFWQYDFHISNGCDSKRLLFKEYCAKVLSNTNVVTCSNEREVMLCEQVLRMCRGEDSECRLSNQGEWLDINDAVHILSFRKNYRAKPKKELIVPWHLVGGKVFSITFDANGNSVLINKNGHKISGSENLLNIDLTDIDLPVTVKRP